MLVNKKLGRFKQWAGERMGGEVRTNTSDDFQALEQEMGIRSEGMQRRHGTDQGGWLTCSLQERTICTSP